MTGADRLRKYAVELHERARIVAGIASVLEALEDVATESTCPDNTPCRDCPAQTKDGCLFVRMKTLVYSSPLVTSLLELPVKDGEDE